MHDVDLVVSKGWRKQTPQSKWHCNWCILPTTTWLGCGWLSSNQSPKEPTKTTRTPCSQVKRHQNSCSDAPQPTRTTTTTTNPTLRGCAMLEAPQVTAGAGEHHSKLCFTGHAGPAHSLQHPQSSDQVTAGIID